MFWTGHAYHILFSPNDNKPIVGMVSNLQAARKEVRLAFDSMTVSTAAWCGDSCC